MMRIVRFILLLCPLTVCCFALAMPKPKPNLDSGRDQIVAAPERAVAIFAGGCFWCMEAPFDKTDGVLETISGYEGGDVINPSYEQVSSGSTGHYEALQVIYDPRLVSYERLLDVYWHNIDPLDSRGQFCDKGGQYRSAIFTLDETQKQIAEKSRQELINVGTVGKQIATQIIPAKPFYPAEDYHQNYYQKNPIRYHYYRGRCGRDARLEELWGKAP